MNESPDQGRNEIKQSLRTEKQDAVNGVDISRFDHVAELKAKIEELQRSEERYHKMIEEVEDYAILLLDRDGFIQNWNKGAEKIKGYTEKEIIGENFRIFYLPEDRENKLPEQLIEEAVSKGKAVHEGWRLRKDGSRFWGSIVITALHSQDQILGFSKVTRDLTELKAATDQIKDYASELEFQNKELQQFSYAAAHDLKEPLRKIQFYNSSILQNAGEILPEKEKTYLQSSVNAAIRMSGLIDDLLKYSETSSVAGKFQPVDVIAILNELKDFYQDSLGDDEIKMELGGRLEVWGIPFQIRQLFENLLGNAIKYRQKDRPLIIRVSASKEVKRLRTEPGQNIIKSYFKIAVVDNGIGFESESGLKVFELFLRLHGRHEYPGTGVGLAICKRIVQNHKGTIEASGKAGEGATFTVYLPCN